MQTLRRGTPKLKRGSSTTLKRGTPKSPLSEHFEYNGDRAVLYTTTIEYADSPDHEHVHKSMTTNWLKALNMGLQDLVSSPDFNIEIVPRLIKVQRK
jgi:hypothetical protein